MEIGKRKLGKNFKLLMGTPDHAMMNRDDTYMALLFYRPLSFMKVPKPYHSVPTYLMPAKASLYTNPDLLKAARLYPDLKRLAENVAVPTDKDLNKNLRDLWQED